MSKRRKYSPEFKQGAVEQTRQPEVSCSPFAYELGIASSLLTRWRRESGSADQNAFGGTGSPRDEEVARLKQELTRLKEKRDFLRESTKFFAKESS